MRKVLIVGAGHAGLQLALGLRAHGYEVTVISSRTAEEIRSGRVMFTQSMFRTALQHERDLRLGFWESQAPSIDSIEMSLAGPGPARAANWVGRLDGFAQSVDQRVKLAGWMDTFTRRGGRLVIHRTAVSDLDHLSRTYDLVLVAAGKGELASLFARDEARSPYDAPQRALAISYVHGLGPLPEHPGSEAIRCNLLPGTGEFFVVPTLTTSGPAHILLWEGVPGGPLDVFRGVKDPAEHLSLTLRLMERYVPWEYARATNVELTDSRATLTGRQAPVVRDPVGRLPGGGLVLGVADIVVVNDPVTGQASNSASKCAASYLDSILSHSERRFDERWMRAVFDRYWDDERHTVKWTNAMLAPLAPHVLDLITAAGEHQPVADRIANGCDDPADFEDFFYDPRRAKAYLDGVGNTA